MFAAVGPLRQTVWRASGEARATMNDIDVIRGYGQPRTGGRTMEAARLYEAEGESTALSDRDARILEFENRWWQYSGAKEQAIRELFDMSATRYYQVLNAIIDMPAALEAQPMLVKRLRRMREARQRARSEKRLGISL